MFELGSVVGWVCGPSLGLASEMIRGDVVLEPLDGAANWLLGEVGLASAPESLVKGSLGCVAAD